MVASAAGTEKSTQHGGRWSALQLEPAGCFMTAKGRSWPTRDEEATSMCGVSVYAPQLPVIVPKRVKTLRCGLNNCPLSSVFALFPVAGVATDALRALSRALERQRPE